MAAARSHAARALGQARAVRLESREARTVSWTGTDEACTERVEKCMTLSKVSVIVTMRTVRENHPAHRRRACERATPIGSSNSNGDDDDDASILSAAAEHRPTQGAERIARAPRGLITLLRGVAASPRARSASPSRAASPTATNTSHDDFMITFEKISQVVFFQV
jgi:hypothetical protein